MSNIHVSIVGRNAMLNAIAALMNGGSIKFYDGSQPVNANTAVSSQNLLATLTFSATAFASASGGSASANAITSATIGTTGTCTWARIVESDGTTVVTDCDVGTSGKDITVPTTAFQQNVTLSCSALTISMAA